MYDTLQNNCLLSRSKNKNTTTKKVSHKKIFRTGTVKIHVDPPLIPLLKVRIIQKQKKMVSKLKHLGILCQKNWVYLSLKWPCLITASKNSSCCLFETSK